jgi:hypothetical protein
MTLAEIARWQETAIVALILINAAQVLVTAVALNLLRARDARGDDEAGAASSRAEPAAFRRVGKGALAPCPPEPPWWARHSPSKTGVDALVALPTLRSWFNANRNRAGGPPR